MCRTGQQISPTSTASVQMLFPLLSAMPKSISKPHFQMCEPEIRYGTSDTVSWTPALCLIKHLSRVFAGLWAVHHDPDESQEWPHHSYLIISFARATHVFAATTDPALPFREISDEKHCEYETSSPTLFACTMFAGQGVIQVRTTQQKTCRPLQIVTIVRISEIVSPQKRAGQYLECGVAALAHHRYICRCLEAATHCFLTPQRCLEGLVYGALRIQQRFLLVKTQFALTI